MFKIYRSEKKNIEENWESKVVYIELLNAEGNAVKQAKYLLDADGTNGYFTIPEDILTGKYILLCYTNWMQNFSAAKFGGCLLKIINPYKAKLAPEGINNLKKIENSTNTLFFNPFNIQCQLSKNVYDRREKVEVDLLVPGDVKIADKIFCISVITKGAYNTYQQTEYEITYSKKDNESIYYPEYRGLTLSGRVLDAENREPVAAYVNLSILGDEPGYYGLPVNKDGRFVFNLPELYEQNDLYINSMPVGNKQVEILIDRDFSLAKKISFRSPFTLSRFEKKTGLMCIAISYLIANRNNMK
ncbi:hypothetical protein ES703_25352 [subsurface metagenome]